MPVEDSVWCGTDLLSGVSADEQTERKTQPNTLVVENNNKNAVQFSRSARKSRRVSPDVGKLFSFLGCLRSGGDVALKSLVTAGGQRRNQNRSPFCVIRLYTQQKLCDSMCNNILVAIENGLKDEAVVRCRRTRHCVKLPFVRYGGAARTASNKVR